MSQVIFLQCRWCGAKPKRVEFDENGKQIIGTCCPNPKCRRRSWLYSDEKIKQVKEKQISNLVDGWKFAQDVNKKVWSRKKKPIKRKSICRICDILFDDDAALQRHNGRRH